MKRLRVVVVAPFAPDAEGALENSYARAFRKSGAEVKTISTMPLFTRSRLGGHISPMIKAIQLENALRRDIQDWNPCLVALVKGLGVLPKTIHFLRNKGIRVVNVFPDNPFEIARNSLLGSSIIPQLKLVDTAYVHDRRLVWQLSQLGINANYLSFARDPDLQDPPHFPSNGNQTGIVFVGNPDEERIRYLSAVSDLGLRLYGAWHWAKLPSSDPLSNCIAGSVQAGKDMTKALRQSSLSINILRHSQKTAHNMRTFESPGSGVCTVSERSIGVLSLMREGQDVVTFSTPAELRRVCLRLLADSKAADDIARTGFQHTKDETYLKRVSQITEIERL